MTVIIVAGDLFLLVFSMDSRESFEEVIRLREQILETKLSATANSSGARKRSPNLRVPMVIVGNKCDKDMRWVTSHSASDWHFDLFRSAIFPVCFYIWQIDHFRVRNKKKKLKNYLCLVFWRRLSSILKVLAFDSLFCPSFVFIIGANFIYFPLVFMDLSHNFFYSFLN